jgi:hypothetical protein
MRLAILSRTLLLLALPAVAVTCAAAQDHPNVQPSNVRDQLNKPPAASQPAPAASATKAAAPIQQPKAPTKAAVPVQQPKAPTKAPAPVQPTKAPVQAPAPPQPTKAPAKAVAPAQQAKAPAKAPAPAQPAKAPAKAAAPAQPAKAPAKAPANANLPAKAAAAQAPAKAPAAAKAPAKEAVKKPAKPPVEKPAELKVSGVRRDPFDPLMNKPSQGTETPQALPPGKAGLVVGTLRIDGIVGGVHGMIAIVSNPQQRVYFLREGDKLYDGSVQHITIEAVSFQEVGKDAFGKPLERQVTKRLYPTSSGEQQ